MEERQIKPVVHGTAKVRKKSGIHSLAEVFVSDDIANVKSHIREDVLIPSIRKILYTIISEGAHMIFLGGVGSSKSGGSKVSYRDYYDSTKSYARRPESTGNRFDYDDIIFESRGDAEGVLDEMIEVIGKYGVVTVADMYDMAQLSQPFTSNRYGWTNLSSAEVKRVAGGYILDLPKAKPIER
jgi:hypothetical protein